MVGKIIRKCLYLKEDYLPSHVKKLSKICIGKTKKKSGDEMLKEINMMGFLFIGIFKWQLLLW